MKSIKKRAAGVQTADDQSRVPYASAEVTKTDSFLGGGQTTFSPKVSFGTADFLGASCRNHPSAGRQGTGGFFFKYEHNLNRIQKIPILGSYLSIRSQIQAASHALASSEQLQLGGANSVRGYPEGDYLADDGGILNVDWVFPLNKQAEFALFVDLGGGKLKKITPGDRRSKFLVGVGGGIRFHVERNFFLKLDWAAAVGDRPAGGGGPSSLDIALQFEI
jgi:hemolysin activation/secretion protein